MIKEEDQPLYSYNEVIKTLCPGCQYGLPEVWENGNITHRCGAVEIRCLAVPFRTEKKIHNKMYPGVFV